MKKISLLILGILLTTLTTVSCKNETKEVKEEVNEIIQDIKEENKAEKKEVKVTVESKSDSKAKGSTTFTESDGKVEMVATFEGLTEGEHAIHLHEKADCSSADGKSAGGHWNPTFKPPGKWGATEGYHKGDIGNFTADANGNGTITFSTDEWCIGCGDETKDILGKGVIVHQGTDDFTSQPSGDAGARVSCGGIIQ
jgi:Cu-Zn family superoxide dismutase